MRDHVLIELPVHTARIPTHQALGELSSDGRLWQEHALQRVNNHGRGERLDHHSALAVAWGAFCVQIGACGQIRDQTRWRRTRNAHDVGGGILSHYQTITVDLVGNRSDGRLQYAVSEHVHRQGQILRGELRIDVELSAENDRNRRLVEVLDCQRRARSTDETARFTDVYGVADLAASDGKLIFVCAVNFAGKAKFVFQNHQRFVGDLAYGEQVISHF